jgi:hypothetical protein
VEQRLLRCGVRLGPALDRRSATVLRLEHAFLADQLDALVVAVDGAPVVGDARLLAGRGAHDDHGGVMLTKLAHDRVNQRVGQRRHLDRLFAQHEAGEVEIVDGHVPQQAAGDLHVVNARNVRIAARDQHLPKLADLAGTERVMYRPEGWIEAPIETKHHLGLEAPDLLPARVDALDVEVDRLLAEHGLACFDAGRDQIDMGVRRRGDQHRSDVGVGEGRLDRAGDLGAVSCSRGLRRRTMHVVDLQEARTRVTPDVVGVHLTNTSGAEKCHTEHSLLLA